MKQREDAELAQCKPFHKEISQPQQSGYDNDFLTRNEAWVRNRRRNLSHAKEEKRKEELEAANQNEVHHPPNYACPGSDPRVPPHRLVRLLPLLSPSPPYPQQAAAPIRMAPLSRQMTQGAAARSPAEHISWAAERDQKLKLKAAALHMRQKQDLHKHSLWMSSPKKKAAAAAGSTVGPPSLLDRVQSKVEQQKLAAVGIYIHSCPAGLLLCCPCDDWLARAS